MSFFALFFSLATAAGPTEVLHNVHDGKAILIDVREPDEVASGKIAGAKTFPSSKMNSPEWKAFVKTLPKDKMIYTYCAAGGRAGKVASELNAEGFKAENAGGYNDLKSADQKQAGAAEKK